MSSRSVFVSDFRSAVSAMIDSYNRVMALAQHAQVMAWDEADYDLVLGGSDISGAEFVSALTSVGTLAQTFGQDHAAILAKLKP